MDRCKNLKNIFIKYLKIKFRTVRFLFYSNIQKLTKTKYIQNIFFYDLILILRINILFSLLIEENK